MITALLLLQQFLNLHHLNFFLKFQKRFHQNLLLYSARIIIVYLKHSGFLSSQLLWWGKVITITISSLDALQLYGYMVWKECKGIPYFRIKGLSVKALNNLRKVWKEIPNSLFGFADMKIVRIGRSPIRNNRYIFFLKVPSTSRYASGKYTLLELLEYTSNNCLQVKLVHLESTVFIFFKSVKRPVYMVKNYNQNKTHAH